MRGREVSEPDVDEADVNEPDVDDPRAIGSEPTGSGADGPELIGNEPPALGRDRVIQGYLLASVVSNCGDTVFTIGLAWTAVHLLSPVLAGLVVGVDMLPQAALTLAGGVIADRFDTRRVMLLGLALRVGVLAAALVAWCGGFHSGVVLFAVAIGFGTASGLSAPASATLVRQLVQADDLVTVGGWFQVGSRLSRLMGAPLGAGIVAAGGMAGSMTVDAVSFVGVAIVLIFVVRPRFRLQKAGHEPWRKTLGEGLRYIWSTPVTRTFVLGLAALNVFVSPVEALGVALRVSHSGWGSSWLGIAEATLACGAIGGSILGIRWQGQFLARRAFWTLVTQGVGLGLVGVDLRATLVIGMLLIGVTSGLASVWLSGCFLRVVAPSHLGRVSSVSQLGDLLLIPVMTPVFGALAGHASVTTATLVFGACMSVLCLTFVLRPEISGLR
ncbi:MFS transporter [Rudaeicoccus suwonensis]|uniref:MFS transporter n=2 Tax=Rudaeicoccus suwonensis TaxID=657409 RepID=A0A561DV79_9MICO|nr:MFS transporter [Rudaeicoccus suwonensis]TWE07275.1 MFS transporter [Rudaeicoccus suwonensis]